MNLTPQQQQQVIDAAAILEANAARLRHLAGARFTDELAADIQIHMASNDLLRVAERLDALVMEVA